MYPVPNRGTCQANDHQLKPHPLSSTSNHRAKFIIELRWQKNKDHNRNEVSTLMGKFQFGPDDVKLTYKTCLVVAAMFYYNKWSHARETIVYLWDVLLDGGGGMSFMPPRLIVQKNENENEEELNIRLSVLFKERIIRFMEEKKILNRNVREKELFREFKSAMQCILDHLDGAFDDSCGLKVLRLKGGATCDWSKILWMVKRECRRLDDALSIYAHRTHILSQIHLQQVVVLTGEVGTGKSTQLVQFLVDSGVAGDKSLVCTLPRKLAPLSLVTRVEEESHGCCEDSCSSAYSSFQQSDSKVIYMTDHCLLQHYMNDDNFSWASCVIVDEAQERSLNTDLLLALMKDVLCRESDLRLIIMSATEDARQLSKYFYGCGTYHVVGGTFPADIRDVYEPEIPRVNLGIAVLRMLSLGIYKIEEFDFIDAPCNVAIEAAIKNLIWLGAIVLKEDSVHKLTKDGRMLVKLGIEPRLGKIILKCFENRLGREGLVLAAVMANSSSIFCRGGRKDEKKDRLKVQFCHPGGDLFTLLSVYKIWECTSHSKRNQWCWDMMRIGYNKAFALGPRARA